MVSFLEPSLKLVAKRQLPSIECSDFFVGLLVIATTVKVIQLEWAVDWLQTLCCIAITTTEVVINYYWCLN